MAQVDHHLVSTSGNNLQHLWKPIRRLAGLRVPRHQRANQRHCFLDPWPIEDDARGALETMVAAADVRATPPILEKATSLHHRRFAVSGARHHASGQAEANDHAFDRRSKVFAFGRAVWFVQFNGRVTTSDAWVMNAMMREM